MTPDELFNLAAKSRDLSENAPNPSDRWHFTKLAFAYEPKERVRGGCTVHVAAPAIHPTLSRD